MGEGMSPATILPTKWTWGVGGGSTSVYSADSADQVDIGGGGGLQVSTVPILPTR